MDSVSEGAEVTVGAPAEGANSKNHGKGMTTSEQETVLQAEPVDGAAAALDREGEETTHRAKSQCVIAAESQKRWKAGVHAKQASYYFMQGKFTSMGAHGTSCQLVQKHCRKLVDSGELEYRRFCRLQGGLGMWMMSLGKRQ